VSILTARTPPRDTFAIEGSHGYYEVSVEGMPIGNVHRWRGTMAEWTAEGWIADLAGHKETDAWYRTKDQALLALMTQHIAAAATS
jgi:hypothetical protein